MTRVELTLNLYPTTVTAEDGTFHPAVASGLVNPVYYWNDSYADEDAAEALAQARLSVEEAAAQNIADTWDVQTL